MNLDQIFEEWERDSRTDPTNLGNAALTIPKLHVKYLRLLTNEKLLYRKMEQSFQQLCARKRDWMMGEMTKEELADLGWQPWLRVTPLRSQVDELIKIDSDVVTETLKLAFQKEKVDVLESIMKQIFNRGFQINSAINWAKFQAGA